jgi:flagellar motor switch protein FliN
MSDATRAAHESPIAQCVQTWTDILSQVLGEITGSSMPCITLYEAPTALPAPAASDLWVIAACSGALRGEMSVRIPSAATVRLAQLFVGDPAASAQETTSEHREAAIELFRQVSGLVATAIKPTWGDVQLRLDAAPAAPSWPASSTTWLQVGEDFTAASLLEIQLSAALGAALRSEKTESAPPVAGPSASAPLPPREDKVNLDLLMDAELAVTLRFGSRRLLLREVLDLNPGAVIDLDRQVQEPVDLLLDGRVLARGEVVVMDGNYGLRITEVAPAGV